MSMDSDPLPIISLFATNLRRHRRSQGLSQERLAALAGLDRTYVSSCERGLRNVTIETLAGLGHALRISPSTLIEESAPHES